MTRFTNTKGLVFEVAITGATLKRSREWSYTDKGGAAVKVDIPDLLTPKGIALLNSDMGLMLEILFVCCKPSADAHRVDFEAFLDGMAGDCIEQAQRALEEALVAFCQNPRDRAALQRVLKAVGTTLDAGRNRTQALLEGNLLETRMAAALGLESAAGNFSGSAQESSV